MNLQHLNLSESWLTTISTQLRAANLTPTDDEIFKQYLTSDLRSSSQGTLPDFQTIITNKSNEAHILQGSYVLQVEDWCNIALDEEKRRLNQETELKTGTSGEMSSGAGANSRRTLLLSLTDGVTVVSALEVESLSTNFVQALRKYKVPGLKISLNQTKIRHGILMLSNTSIVVLGGVLASATQPPVSIPIIGGGGGGGGGNGGVVPQIPVVAQHHPVVPSSSSRSRSVPVTNVASSSSSSSSSSFSSSSSSSNSSSFSATSNIINNNINRNKTPTTTTATKPIPKRKTMTTSATIAPIFIQSMDDIDMTSNDDDDKITYRVQAFVSELISAKAKALTFTLKLEDCTCAKFVQCSKKFLCELVELNNNVSDKILKKKLKEKKKFLSKKWSEIDGLIDLMVTKNNTLEIVRYAKMSHGDAEEFFNVNMKKGGGSGRKQRKRKTVISSDDDSDDSDVVEIRVKKKAKKKTTMMSRAINLVDSSDDD